MKKILLDTNAYSAFMTGDEKILEVIAKAEQVLLSAIVVGELHAGFKGGKKEQQNKEYLTRFLEKPTVTTIDVTIETAEFFGHIKQLLKKAGTPIPINDIWIAAHTTETGSTIITYDKHFTKVPGLKTWDEL